jgi:hypothetical protein
MNATSRLATAWALAAACGAALAQTATPPASPAASRPDAVATSPETAQAANDKAVKRSDVATVVRTGPTAGDRARLAAARTEARVDGTASTDGTTIAGDSARSGTRDVTLAPRADRN